LAHGLDFGFALMIVLAPFLARLLPGQVVAIALVVQGGHPLERIPIQSAITTVNPFPVTVLSSR
jgi:hypothetical protein